MRYTTDHKWKSFKYRYEVPQAVLDSDFDYQDAEETFDGYFRYRNVWYHLDGFMRSDDGHFSDAPIRIHGFASDSAFSGVGIEISSDGETYRVTTVTT
jgi:hypothetical protein